jgi:hypothetical protein
MPRKMEADLMGLERVETRCRICRDPELRLLVDALLDWRGVPVPLEGGRVHRVTYSDVLRALEPFNGFCGDWETVTYNNLWVHAQRHYDLRGIATYWSRRTEKEVRNFLKDNRCRNTVEPAQPSGASTKNLIDG